MAVILPFAHKPVQNFAEIAEVVIEMDFPGFEDGATIGSSFHHGDALLTRRLYVDPNIRFDNVEEGGLAFVQ